MDSPPNGGIDGDGPGFSVDSKSTIAVNVATDLWGSKDNIQLQFDSLPSLAEMVERVERIYDGEMLGTKPAVLSRDRVPEFAIVAIQLYDPDSGKWLDVNDDEKTLAAGLGGGTEGSRGAVPQVYVFQAPNPMHSDSQEPIPAARKPTNISLSRRFRVSVADTATTAAPKQRPVTPTRKAVPNVRSSTPTRSPKATATSPKRETSDASAGIDASSKPKPRPRLSRDRRGSDSSRASSKADVMPSLRFRQKQRNQNNGPRARGTSGEVSNTGGRSIGSPRSVERLSRTGSNPRLPPPRGSSPVAANPVLHQHAPPVLSTRFTNNSSLLSSGTARNPYYDNEDNYITTSPRNPSAGRAPDRRPPRAGSIERRAEGGGSRGHQVSASSGSTHSNHCDPVGELLAHQPSMSSEQFNNAYCAFFLLDQPPRQVVSLSALIHVLIALGYDPASTKTFGDYFLSILGPELLQDLRAMARHGSLQQEAHLDAALTFADWLVFCKKCPHAVKPMIDILRCPRDGPGAVSPDYWEASPGRSPRGLESPTRTQRPDPDDYYHYYSEHRPRGMHQHSGMVEGGFGLQGSYQRWVGGEHHGEHHGEHQERRRPPHAGSRTPNRSSLPPASNSSFSRLARGLPAQRPEETRRSLSAECVRRSDVASRGSGRSGSSQPARGGSLSPKHPHAVGVIGYGGGRLDRSPFRDTLVYNPPRPMHIHRVYD